MLVVVAKSETKVPLSRSPKPEVSGIQLTQHMRLASWMRGDVMDDTEGKLEHHQAGHVHWLLVGQGLG